jgi:hypothetical protein
MDFRVKDGYKKWVSSMKKSAKKGTASDFTLDILNRIKRRY